LQHNTRDAKINHGQSKEAITMQHPQNAQEPGMPRPWWQHQVHCPPQPPLAGDAEADIVVVGGGITGLTAAMALQNAGRQVIVLEMNRVGSGTTGSSSGHLDTTNDESIHKLLKHHEKQTVQDLMQAKRRAIDSIEQWDKEFDLQSDFRRIPGYLYAEMGQQVKHLDDELAAAHQVELAADMSATAPLPFATEGAIVWPDQARFSPLAYVCRLAERFVARGGRLHEQTRVEGVEESERCHVVTEHGTVTADTVILAGHTPLAGTFTLQTRAYPYQSYCIAVRVYDDVPDALYWDLASPYHYTRHAVTGDPHLLIIGGADHHTGTTKQEAHSSIQALERYARGHYRVEEVEQSWSHEFFTSPDGLPFVGNVPGREHILVGAVFSGDGLTFGTAAGLALARLAQGQPDPFAEACTPARIKPLASAKRMGSAFIHVGRHFIGDRLGGGQVADVAEIPAGAGRLLSVGGHTYAVYRDDANHLHVMSPVCTHMKCIVQWNDAENTWDCPCHGGRYTATGKPLTGPPMKPLQPKSVEELERE
jgi:glycine/D-amino acid oxidase-like deaminating enzyme/nitrite reductase/ring-hydroxylating ferredoxin subunit